MGVDHGGGGWSVIITRPSRHLFFSKLTATGVVGVRGRAGGVLRGRGALP